MPLEYFVLSGLECKQYKEMSNLFFFFSFDILLLIRNSMKLTQNVLMCFFNVTSIATQETILIIINIYRKLAGHTIFITGASRGIGKSIALKAAKDGANIVIAAKTAQPHPKLPGTIYTAASESNY